MNPNNKFGELTVLRESLERVRNAIAWECVCSCGNEILVERYRILNGSVKSCGCLRKKSPPNTIDMTGQTFGKLTVVERAGKTIRDNALWLCQCECGKSTVAMGTSLRRGDTVSCGCDNITQMSRARKVLMEDMSVDGVQLPLLNKKVRSDSATKHKGVTRRVRKGKETYEVNITVRGHRRYLGTFTDINKAIAARKAGEEKYHKPYLEGNNHEQQ